MAFPTRHGVTPKQMVYNGESHLEMDDDWGYPATWSRVNGKWLMGIDALIDKQVNRC